MKANVHTLLVPIDFSDVTPNVLDTARSLALAFKSRVVLFHIAEPEPDFVGFEPGPVSVRSSVAKEFHAEHRHLEDAKQPFAAAGVDVLALQIQGPTIEKILHESLQQNAGMIVLGSHGHGALHGLLTGSVAAGVLKASHCPVLVVPAAQIGREFPASNRPQILPRFQSWMRAIFRRGNTRSFSCRFFARFKNNSCINLANPTSLVGIPSTSTILVVY